jgi:hypothetical protein
MEDDFQMWQSAVGPGRGSRRTTCKWGESDERSGSEQAWVDVAWVPRATAEAGRVVSGQRRLWSFWGLGAPTPFLGGLGQAGAWD